MAFIVLRPLFAPKLLYLRQANSLSEDGGAIPGNLFKGS